MIGSGFHFDGPGLAPSQPDTRYEYRVWPGATHPALSQLQCGWKLVAAERRSDIYLLKPDQGRFLVKLRDGQELEIKRRMRDVGTIQHWTAPLSAGFPLSAGHRGALSEALGLSGGVSQETGLSPAHLLSAFGTSGNGVSPRTVRKSRLLFERSGCRAEICRVAVGGWSGFSVALEAPALPAITRATDELRLGTHPNRSYGEMLASLAGRRRARPAALVHIRNCERRDR